MVNADLQRAWVRQAQLDAERGVIECRMCKQRAGLGQAVTLWRNDALVFAVCDRCAAGHDIVMRPTEAGIEIRGLARQPIVLAGSAGP
jgi:hypothetical protein